MTRPHEILANDLLFAGCYANETEQQAAVRRLKRNEAAARALLALDDEVERLRADGDAARERLDLALGMLADWCVAVDVGGTQWDDWDDCYKEAMYRHQGSLRVPLDKAIAEAMALRAEWDKS